MHILLITEYLFLFGNHLTSTIPTELGLLSNLEYLDLSSNQLIGTIPTSLGGLSLLSKSQSLLFQVEDTVSSLWVLICACISSLIITGGLYLLANNLTGTIPTELGLLSNLEYLDLYSNQLNGTLPTSLASLSLLSKLQ